MKNMSLAIDKVNVVCKGFESFPGKTSNMVKKILQKEKQMSGKIVEISLKSLMWKKNGEIRQSKKGNNVLTFELIYPAPGKSKVGTIKKLKLKAEGSIDFTGIKNTETGESYSFSDRIVFKEEIYGECALAVQLTNVLTSSGIKKLLKKLLKGLYNTVWGLITGSVTNVVVGIPLDVVTSELEGIDTDSDDKVYNIGHASKDIHSNQFQAPGSSHEIDLELKVPKDVIRNRYTHPDPNRMGGGELTPVTILHKGDSNGKLVLNVKVL
jgi:hypothetical protein